MKIENIRAWMIIVSAVTLLIYIGTVAVAYDQERVKTRILLDADVKIATQETEIKALKFELANMQKSKASYTSIITEKTMEISKQADEVSAKNKAAMEIILKHANQQLKDLEAMDKPTAAQSKKTN